MQTKAPFLCALLLPPLLSACFQFESIESNGGEESGTTAETAEITAGSVALDPNTILIVEGDGSEERFSPDFDPERSTTCTLPDEQNGPLFLVWLRDSNTPYFLTIALDMAKAQEIETATRDGNPVSEVITSAEEDPIVIAIGDANKGQFLYSSKAYPSATEPERGVIRFNHLGTEALQRTSGVILRAILPQIDLEGFALIQEVEFNVSQVPQTCVKLAL